MDLASWVKCFATYVGVLTGSSPQAVRKLMADLIEIVRVNQDSGRLAGLITTWPFNVKLLRLGISHNQKSTCHFTLFAFRGHIEPTNFVSFATVPHMKRGIAQWQVGVTTMWGHAVQ